MLGCHLTHELSERMLFGDSSQYGGKIELVKIQADPLLGGEQATHLYCH